MARVVAFVPDLLFGSKVQAMLVAAGHDVALASGAERTRSGLAAGADVLVLDLTADADDALALLEALRGEGVLDRVRTLAFYSHVEADVRTRALDAGLDQVVPRSRMAREGGDLVSRLLTVG